MPHQRIGQQAPKTSLRPGSRSRLVYAQPTDLDAIKAPDDGLQSYKDEADEILSALSNVAIEEFRAFADSLGDSSGVVQWTYDGDAFKPEPVDAETQQAHALDTRWNVACLRRTEIVFFAKHNPFERPEFAPVVARVAWLMDQVSRKELYSSISRRNVAPLRPGYEVTDLEFVTTVVQRGLTTGTEVPSAILDAMQTAVLQADPTISASEMLAVALNSAGLPISASSLDDTQFSVFRSVVEVEGGDEVIDPSTIIYNSTARTATWFTPPRSMPVPESPEEDDEREDDELEEELNDEADLGEAVEVVPEVEGQLSFEFAELERRDELIEEALTKEVLIKHIRPRFGFIKAGACPARLNAKPTGLAPVTERWEQLAHMRAAFWQLRLPAHRADLPSHLETQLSRQFTPGTLVITSIQGIAVRITPSLDEFVHIDGNSTALEHIGIRFSDGDNDTAVHIWQRTAVDDVFSDPDAWPVINVRVPELQSIKARAIANLTIETSAEVNLDVPRRGRLRAFLDAPQNNFVRVHSEAIASIVTGYPASGVHVAYAHTAGLRDAQVGVITPSPYGDLDMPDDVVVVHGDDKPCAPMLRSDPASARSWDSLGYLPSSVLRLVETDLALANGRLRANINPVDVRRALAESLEWERTAARAPEFDTSAAGERLSPTR